MSNRAKRIAALLLAAITIMLYACSGQKSEGKPVDVSGLPVNGGYSAELANVHYKGDYKQMDGKRNLRAGCFTGGRFYYTASGDSSVNDDEYNAIFSCLPDGSNVQRFDKFAAVPSDYFGEETIEMGYIRGIYTGGDCLYVLESAYTKPTAGAESVTGTEHTLLHKVSISGDERTITDITESLAKNSDEDFSLRVDANGNVYCLFYMNPGLIVYNSNGEELFSLGNEIGYCTFIETYDGAVLVSRSTSDYYGQEILAVNVSGKCLDKKMTVPTNSTSLAFYPGVDGFDFTYSNGTSLYGANIETKETALLLSFINCGIDYQSLTVVLPMEDGLSCVNTEYGLDAAGNSKYSWGITALKRYEGSEVDGKTVLTMAIAYDAIDDSIYKAMLKFNRTNQEYRIEVNDYSGYSVPGDAFAGASVLNTEIISGKAPDVFLTDGMDSSIYADRGILEDLWPYIDADKELGGRKALVEPVFNAMQHRSGALYEITPTFQIYYIVGNRDVVGDGSDWTFDKFKSALASMPDGCAAISGLSRLNMLYHGSRFRLYDFIDWKNGTCSFNTPEFEEYLTFIKDYFPAEIDWSQPLSNEEKVLSGETLLYSGAMFSFDDFQKITTLYKGKESFVGWPGAQSSRCHFGLGSRIAMCSASEHKEAVWEFMRLVLTEEIQLSDENLKYSFHTNKKVFDTMLDERCNPQYDTGGKEIPKSAVTIGGTRIEFYAMTSEQRSEFLSLIENTTSSDCGDDGSIFEIVMEEANAFFDGKQDAKKTAEAVQSRVTIYMNEKK